MLDKARRAPVAEPSAAIKRKLDVSFEMQDGFRVYTIKPRIHASAGHLFYIHGGASVFEIAPHHWSFVARMVERLGVACTVPLYPLAPEHDCIKALAFMTRVYRKLTATHDPAGLVIMGDSAGAGFGMSLAIQAKAEGLPLPGGLVLISPSLDPTMSHPSQEEIEKCDPLLDRQIARIYVSCWPGPWDPADPRISPLNGDLAGVPPILMFCGSADIVVADARRLAQKAPLGTVEYHEEPGLMHGYVLLFFRESRRAQDRIVAFVEGLWQRGSQVASLASKRSTA